MGRRRLTGGEDGRQTLPHGHQISKGRTAYVRHLRLLAGLRTEREHAAIDQQGDGIRDGGVVDRFGTLDLPDQIRARELKWVMELTL
jgi:hypothetical protein